MGTLTGVWTHSAGPTPLANTAGTGDKSSGDTASATISANDFLTLLVTEMQNQDPTAATDPNEYINQLVNVNSLQQLISINQTLTTAMTDPASAATPGTESRGEPSPPQINHALPKGSAEAAGRALSSVASTQGLASKTVQGNLDVPRPNPSANAVARALTRH